MTTSHIDSPRKTVRQVLPESVCKGMRVSPEAKEKVRAVAAENGCSEWMALDILLGVK